MNVGKIFKPDGVIFVHCPNCIFSTFNLEERMTFETPKKVMVSKQRKIQPSIFSLRFEANPRN